MCLKANETAWLNQQWPYRVGQTNKPYSQLSPHLKFWLDLPLIKLMKVSVQGLLIFGVHWFLNYDYLSLLALAEAHDSILTGQGDNNIVVTLGKV